MRHIGTIISSIALLSTSLWAGPPITQQEAESLKLQDATRASGFSDIEIDNLHQNIADNIKRIKELSDLGVDKTSSKFLYDEPTTEANVFKKDSEGKTYLEFKLKQGQSVVDWPKYYLYEGTGFIYPKEDFSGLDKIVFMFKRVNADGDTYVREMRRVINPTPNGPQPDGENGAPKTDSNADIQLEFFQDFNSYIKWPKEPVQKEQPAVVMTLHKAEAPLPYDKQKMIINNYRKILRSIDKDVNFVRNGIELDQKRMISKMLDYR